MYKSTTRPDLQSRSHASENLMGTPLALEKLLHIRCTDKASAQGQITMRPRDCPQHHIFPGPAPVTGLCHTTQTMAGMTGRLASKANFIIASIDTEHTWPAAALENISANLQQPSPENIISMLSKVSGTPTR